MEVRRTLAACYHELLANKKDYASFKRLDKVLDSFLQDSMLKESGVQTLLSKNLTLITKNYFAQLNIQDFVNRILLKRRAKQNGLNQEEISQKQKRMQKNNSDFETNLSQKDATSLEKFDSKETLARKSSHQDTLFSGVDEYKPDDFMAEKLFQFVPREYFPDNKLHEIAYSQLLDHFVLLFDKIIISQGGSRRDCDTFLRNMTPVMHHFNPIEIQDYFVEKLDALITFSCDLVRGGVFCFLSHLISLHYRKEIRMSLIQKIKEYAYTGSTIQQRKNFITFCSESILVNTPERDGIFEKFFFPYLIKLGYSESNYSVLMHLIKHLPQIREGILISGNPNGLLEFI